MRVLFRSPFPYKGLFYPRRGEPMHPKPVQKPSLPIWMGVGHPDAIRRTARLADGWMGSGGSRKADFIAAIPMLKEALAKNGRDPDGFPISKRVFLCVNENAATARAELLRWFTEVYHNPPGVDSCGIHGTPEQVAEQLEELSSHGATHLLLNPTCRYTEQVAALA